MLSPHELEAVCGPMVEGALLAQMVAEEIGAEFYFAEQFQRPESSGLYPVGYRIPKSMRAALRGNGRPSSTMSSMRAPQSAAHARTSRTAGRRRSLSVR